MISEVTTVRDIATALPEAARIFARAGIDCSCSTVESLRDACSAAGADVGEVLRQIQALTEEAQPAPARDWSSETARQVVSQILEVHHAHLKEELPRLEQLMNRVYEKHGKTYAEILKVHEIFFTLKDELEMHLRKEEVMLFPYVLRLEDAQVQGLPFPPCPFGTVANPVRVMIREHDSAEEAMQAIRTNTADYTPPANACLGFTLLLQGLQALEEDLRVHIRLENEVLFPKAVGLEQSCHSSPAA